MQAFPHNYQVQVRASQEGLLCSESGSVPSLNVAPPTAFGGPGDQWSPEDLLVAALANCFVLSFRAIAQASKLEWIDIHCDTSGILDKVEKTICFTGFTINARLVVPSDDLVAKAERLLQRAEQTCLVSNSLSADVHLECDIAVG